MKYQTFFGYLTLSCILILTPVKLGLARTNNGFQLAQNSDDFFQECFRNSKNQNQSDMTYCAQLEYRELDNKLNQVYQQLRSQLPNASKQLLADAQVAWISFRDKEWVFSLSTMRLGTGGSMYPSMKASFYSDSTKKRTVELQSYVRGQALPPSSGNYQAVDRRLNQVYQQVRSSVGARQQLQSAQIAWIEFRDASCQFESARFSTSDNACLTRLAEQRIERLSRLLPRNR